MDYEQKYAKALWQMKELYNRIKYLSSPEALLTTVTLENTFPELKESEDERIRKGLIRGLSAMRDIHKHQTFSDDAINIDDAISWLEKQGEQKASWSEEDEKTHEKLLFLMEEENSISSWEGCYEWLKSLKERVQPQPKQEWSEYDKIQLSEAIQIIEANGTWIRSEDAVKKVSNWLKSLKPNHWKPSEEEMGALLYALGKGGTYNREALTKLYNNLKNL